jgi:hypothetical protein
VSLKRKAQTTSLMLRMKHPEADRLIGQLVESSDFHTTYAVLDQAFEFFCHRELEELVGVTRSRDRFQALLDRARGKHGELADLLLPVFEEGWRQTDIAHRRAEIKNEDHRFLLALLLNVPEKTRMLELVNEKFPDANAIDLVVGWVRELSATKTFGSKEPNLLGNVEFDKGHFIVLKGLLQGLTVEEINAQAAGEAQPPGSHRTIEEMANDLRALTMFSEILRPS